MKLTYKGYGRIYVEKAEDVPAVKDIIREMDAYEHDGYLPSDLIAPFSEYPKVSYVHKFNDLDMAALTAICWSRGIRIWVVDAGRADYVPDAVKALATKQAGDEGGR